MQERTWTSGGAERGVKGVALVVPFVNDENPYIECQKALLRKQGWTPVPLDASRGWGRLASDLLNAQNRVVLNWQENRVFEKHGGSLRVSLKGTSKYLAICAVSIFSRARVINVVHNHAVHDVPAPLRALSVLAIRVLCRVADRRVVHDPSSAGRYRATYVPHPLYGEILGHASVGAAAKPAPRAAGEVRYLVLGALRPYKQLHLMLRSWPPGQKLVIAGRGDAEYVATLRAIITERSLSDGVEVHEGFVADHAFQQRLSQTDVLILPHENGSSLVSGGFFAAVGQVPAVLARRSAFIDWVRHEVPGVYTFTDEADLPRALSEVAAALCSSTVADADDAARSLFGRDACLRAYERVLG